GLLRHVARYDELVLLEKSPASIQPAQQPSRDLRIAQESSTHARIGGEGGPRGERIETRGSRMVGRDEARLRKTEARVAEQRVDDCRQPIETERGELRL